MEQNSCIVPTRVDQALRELKLALNDLYGERLHGVYLYGSYSRGEATPDSDVDLLVVLKGPTQTGREIDRMNPAVSRICLDYDLLISAMPVSLDSFERRRSAFLVSAGRDAVAL